MKYLILSFLITSLSSFQVYSQLNFGKSVSTIPRSKNSVNANNLKMDKIEFNGTEYYMIRFHNFAYHSKHEHPDMVPYCDHPTAYIERYYFYIFDVYQMELLKKHFESKSNFKLTFIAEGSFDKEFSTGESAGVFNWPNLKTTKAVKESLEAQKSSSVFIFDFDKEISGFTPIHFENFVGDSWLKNKKIEKFLSLLE